MKGKKYYKKKSPTKSAAPHVSPPLAPARKGKPQLVIINYNGNEEN